MKQLFFDFDGTIADSEVGIVKSIKYFINKMGLPELTDDQYRQFIGPALVTSIHKFYPHLSENDVSTALKYYQEYYEDAGIFQLDIYPGILEELGVLKNAGYHLHIASAKPEDMINLISDHFDLGHYFDGEFGATSDERTRITKTAVLKYALEKTGANHKDSVMIGDRDTDMIGGYENQVKTLGVTYGFGDVPELSQAHASLIVNQPDEIRRGVEQLSVRKASGARFN
ncbi:MAG: HAD hydrolase-like protein [Lentilactobacillus diolivorans]|jgi:phosphoglycolate phosphatase|uniref:5-nucleotidase n=3 Tax=Lentilactobacillus diolivorans TaxID=179838 RepID=A0A0R1SNC9_9LACO|nr:HAD hydrolase-like protein [Lentilactobacillus diolivorans]KRL68034.1 5-nucleotidase [Lentilactobacillus diolivorans DSM 14421]MCH4163691.1 HAD hydrolase-like protein [Lentilactobacillus diolivorans]RRG03584.1 MAG: HAD family hydrolase [Lactobacillus sp.]GEP25146.1 phosphatase [Lentilactobacillus diolivorans]